ARARCQPAGTDPCQTTIWSTTDHRHKTRNPRRKAARPARTVSSNSLESIGARQNPPRKGCRKLGRGLSLYGSERPISCDLRIMRDVHLEAVFPPVKIASSETLATRHKMLPVRKWLRKVRRLTDDRRGQWPVCMRCE